MNLCWWCRTKLSNPDSTLIWDVRLCCKKCFKERLVEWNDSLNKKIAQQQGSNKLIEASESNNSPKLQGLGGDLKKTSQ